jgi:hypothetical protein
MAKQLNSMNPAYLQSLPVTVVTAEVMRSLNGKCHSDYISDGKVAFHHSIPYTRSCWDFYSVATGEHLKRVHLLQDAAYAYDSLNPGAMQK